MKRFVNLGNQLNEEEKEFAFYCTVKESFETFYGQQTFVSVKEFRSAFYCQELITEDSSRYTDKIPAEFYKKNKYESKN